VEALCDDKSHQISPLGIREQHGLRLLTFSDVVWDHRS